MYWNEDEDKFLDNNNFMSLFQLCITFYSKHFKRYYYLLNGMEVKKGSFIFWMFIFRYNVSSHWKKKLFFWITIENKNYTLSHSLKKIHMRHSNQSYFIFHPHSKEKRKISKRVVCLLFSVSLIIPFYWVLWQ